MLWVPEQLGFWESMIRLEGKTCPYSSVGLVFCLEIAAYLKHNTLNPRFCLLVADSGLGLWLRAKEVA